jgi:hypothetical protein
VPYPRAPRRLPIILTREEAIRLIYSASNLFHRAMLITMYSTGMRRAELCRLKVEDIDSTCMLIHIRQGKGGKDRDVPLSPKVLETLREYWRWMKPQTYMFPGDDQRLTCGQADHAQSSVGSVPGSGSASRDHESRAPASAAAQLCHPLSRRRSGSADRSGVARAYRPEAHFYLSASVRAPHQSGWHTARQHGAFQTRPGEAVAKAAQKMNRPPFEVADIIRAHGDSFVESIGADPWSSLKSPLFNRCGGDLWGGRASLTLHGSRSSLSRSLAAAGKPEVCPAFIGDPKTGLSFAWRSKATPHFSGGTNLRTHPEVIGGFRFAEPEVLPSIEHP